MIDEVDKKILRLLQNNARISNAEIARRIKMAPSGVLERVRKLENKGIILGYETRLDHKKLGMVLSVFIFVKTRDAVGSSLIGENITKIDEVQEVFYIAGEYNYLLKARVSNTNTLRELLKKIGDTGGVVDTRTILVIDELLETLELDVEGVQERVKSSAKRR